ncbi:hypothetical protein C8R45DRAFT_933120 [Mycena sanguinolenta]|nr:hypothetical protein C8R45DRAFT_933120 [Mycena sanguinolenta]
MCAERQATNLDSPSKSQETEPKHQGRSPTPEKTLISYHKTTTSIVYGLLEYEQYQMLREYRKRFQADAAVNQLPYATYDLCCQYYKNLHTVQAAWTHSDSDDSIFDSDNEDMPPLELITETSDGPISLLWNSGHQTTNVPDAPTSAQSATTHSTSPASSGSKRGAGFVPVSHVWAAQHCEGEAVEREWGWYSALRTGVPSVDRDAPSLHSIRLISLQGARDVECDCTDGQHSSYNERQAYTFLDHDGNVVRRWLPRHVVSRRLAKPVSAVSYLFVPSSVFVYLVARQMTSLNISSQRAPKQPQRDEADIQYEMKPRDIIQDMTFYVSGDGKRTVKEPMNMGVKKRKISPSDLVDVYGEWIPLPGESGDGDEAELVDNDDGSGSGEKRKRYESSDDPMNLWRPLMPCFLDELLRHEGLREDSSICSCCNNMIGLRDHQFRCLNCGEFTQCLVPATHCLRCITSVPGVDGTFLERRHASQFGLCISTGAWWPSVPPPSTDEFGAATSKRVVPCDHGGPTTCATFTALELFRLLNVIGNINVNDFIGILEHRTSTLEMRAVPDQYKAFGRMTRQYAFLKRLKHAGRGHDPNGLHNTKTGECAVMCWACPHDGINLPEGWREVAPEFSNVGQREILKLRKQKWIFVLGDTSPRRVQVESSAKFLVSKYICA